MLLAQKLVLDSEFIPYIKIEQSSDKVESPKKVTVILVVDNLLDDSIKGIWYKIVFIKALDNNWIISSIDQAIKCWKNKKQIFQKESCL